jgi:capsular polysaccharide transport system ATP-binding protein
MIEVHNVTKIYPTHDGSNVVLNDISSVFPALTNVGVLGLNGAGKSTLLRILAGAELPDSGRVVHRGHVSWPIGFSGGFNGSLTAEENCRFVARVYGVDLDDTVGFAMEFSELDRYFHMPVRTYSSGMKGRLAFGLSMAIDFDVYLVDEVTAVGDRRFRQKCRDAFEERSDRSSVIIVSHSLATVKAYCDHCAVLKHGKLYYFESVDAAQRTYEAA